MSGMEIAMLNKHTDQIAVQEELSAGLRKDLDAVSMEVTYSKSSVNGRLAYISGRLDNANQHRQGLSDTLQKALTRIDALEAQIATISQGSSSKTATVDSCITPLDFIRDDASQDAPTSVLDRSITITDGAFEYQVSSYYLNESDNRMCLDIERVEK